MDNKCNVAGVKEVILFNASDIKVKNGIIYVKRKYGKFKRPIIKIIPNK